MNSLEENIQSVKEGDKWFHERYYYRKRFVAEINNELERGLSILTEHRYTLHAMVTAKRYQGTGLSQLLFNFIKEWIKEHKGKLILVETWEDNIAARKFYEKLGFQQYASLPNGLKNRNGEGYVNEILYVYEIGT
ncbi:MAG: GNAT family N-acetyltransferase [Promethearchaeota archaeon]|nr:MAG: GNAT family N-acetyltransferase [Candidatus Lokiarchaeota archaeon]